MPFVEAVLIDLMELWGFPDLVVRWVFLNVSAFRPCFGSAFAVFMLIQKRTSL